MHNTPILFRPSVVGWLLVGVFLWARVSDCFILFIASILLSAVVYLLCRIEFNELAPNPSKDVNKLPHINAVFLGN